MYNTKQKQILIDYFSKNNDRHFSVSDIAHDLENKDIGKSTLYRLIDKMTKDGVLIKLRGDNGKSVLYQYVGDCNKCYNHFHLKCTECGLLIHLECDHLISLNNHISNHHKFNLDFKKNLLYGVCSKCTHKEA